MQVASVPLLPGPPISTSSYVRARFVVRPQLLTLGYLPLIS
jgi:hypothetical protein